MEPLSAGPAYTLTFLVFPNGRLPSRRWRPFAWLTLGAIGLISAWYGFAPGGLRYFESEPNPFGLNGADSFFIALRLVAFPLFAVCIVASVGSVFIRLRRATGVERHQLKWVAYAATLFAAAFLASLLVPGMPSIFRPVFVVLPLSIGIATLKYRLYDIDVIINRTLVYGAVSVSLAGSTYSSSTP